MGYCPCDAVACMSFPSCSIFFVCVPLLGVLNPPPGDLDGSYFQNCWKHVLFFPALCHMNSFFFADFNLYPFSVINHLRATDFSESFCRVIKTEGCPVDS